MAGIIFLILLANFVAFCFYSRHLSKKSLRWVWFFLSFPAPIFIILGLKLFFPELSFLR